MLGKYTHVQPIATQTGVEAPVGSGFAARRLRSRAFLTEPPGREDRRKRITILASTVFALPYNCSRDTLHPCLAFRVIACCNGHGQRLVATMMHLGIRLLGAPELAVGGIPLDLQQQKARALLFYLGATGRAHVRDHLATLLWGESDAPEAHHSLRSTLYLIRRALQAHGAADSLVVDRAVVRLDLQTLACDLLRYYELVTENTENALIEAVTVCSGPFLQGFALRDAPEFDRWQRQTALDLLTSSRATLERLIDLAVGRGATGEAVRYLHLLTRLDPLDEPAQRRLLGAYLEQGHVARAMRQFEEFETELRQELGVSPEPETAALIRQALLRRGAPSQPPQAARAPAQLPFIGRDNARQRLRAVAHEVAQGRGATVLIEGADGIGKTRLLSEFGDELAHVMSWPILRGACSPFDDLLEFGPFIEAFQGNASRGAVLGDLADLFTTPAEQTDALSPGLFLRVLKAIRFLAQGGPLALAIEDLQWASSSTLRLFGFLAARLHDLPVLLIGTAHRADDIPALLRLLVVGRRRGEVRLITLDPLSAEAIAELLRALQVTSPSLPSLGAWLEERSGGNPYLLSELLAQLRSEAILTKRADEWHVDAGRWLRWRATAALPETAHDLVLGRLASLTAAARQTLDVLAVAGEPVPYELLRALPDGPGERTLEVLEELRGRELIIESADNLVDLAHHLFRETLLRRLGRLRQRALHHQLAGMIEVCPDLQRRVPLRLVALHAVAGGDVARARRFGLRALESLQGGDLGPLGVEFLRDLYELLAPSSSPAERFLLACALGRACRETGSLDEARRWFEQALASARDAEDTTAQIEAHFEQAELALVAHDYQAAVAAAKLGLATRRGLQPHARVSAGQGHWLVGAALAMSGADLAQARRHLKIALEAYRRDASATGQCKALFELGNVAAQHGRLEQALAYYAEAAREAESAGDHYFLALAHNNFAYHSLLMGRVEVARKECAEGRRIAEQASIPAALLHLCSTEGEIALYAGEWSAAEDAFQSGLALAEELGSLERQAGYRAGLALVALGMGQEARATRLFEDALALLEDHGYWHLQARIHLWLAEALLVSERRIEARTALDAALDIARAHHRDLLLLQGQRLHARLLAADGNWDEAAGLFAQLLKRAQRYSLLEGAHTQVAWGACAMRYGPPEDRASGRALLVETRSQLVRSGALADVATIDRALAD
jgi:DNA-binding SARP family transcriptional activator/predicted ATPase